MEIAIHSQLCVKSITSIHIHMVTATPEEGLPLLHLQPGQIYRAAAPEIEVLMREIAAYNCHQVDLIIERGSRRKIGSGPTKHRLNTCKWCLNGIQSHRTNN